MKTKRTFILVFSFLLNFYIYAAQEKPAGKILLSKGQVFVLNAKAAVVADPEGKRSRSTKSGSLFYVNETIQTKADGRVKLEFFHGGPQGKNEVVLGPNSSLVIQSAPSQATEKSSTKLSLTNGQIRANIRKKYSGTSEDSFEISTPNAVAGVRGTIFSVFYNASTGATDFVTEVGRIAAKSTTSNAPPVTVEAGKFTSTSATGVTPPQPLSENPKLQQAVESLGDQNSFSAKGPESNAVVASGSTSEESSSSNGATKTGSDGAPKSDKSEVTKEESSAAPLGRQPESEGRAIASAPETGGMMGDVGKTFAAEVKAFGGVTSDLRTTPAMNPPAVDIKKALDNISQVTRSANEQNNSVNFSDSIVTIVVR